jgi:hypothetical protein
MQPNKVLGREGVFVRDRTSPSVVIVQGRGVQDAPHARGMMGWRAEAARIGKGLAASVFSPLWHFPLSRKRFMVRRGFTIGKIK